ncbi:MAG: hypothetical protein ACJ8CR_09625, partial [Roseiflexaceae bacterium]
MGRYVAVHFHFERPASIMSLLTPAFTSPWFVPVGLGGIAGEGYRGDQWLLAGHALEYFVSFFTSRVPRTPLSIEVASPANSTDQPYLASLKEAIRQRVDLSHQLSPFEVAAPEVGVTFLPSARLDASVAEMAEQWLGRFPKGVIYLYGAIHIAVQPADEYDWSRTFRFLYAPEEQLPAVGAPFLSLGVRASPFTPNEVQVDLHSRSNVWLEAAQALAGRVGQPEADANLAQLAGLARLIAQANARRLLEVDLNVEGGAFHKERARIEAAFADIR